MRTSDEIDDATHHYLSNDDLRGDLIQKMFQKSSFNIKISFGKSSRDN